MDKILNFLKNNVIYITYILFLSAFIIFCVNYYQKNNKKEVVQNFENFEEFISTLDYNPAKDSLLDVIMLDSITMRLYEPPSENQYTRYANKNEILTIRTNDYQITVYNQRAIPFETPDKMSYFIKDVNGKNILVDYDNSSVIHRASKEKLKNFEEYLIANLNKMR